MNLKQLRASLKEAAGKATPGPWTTHKRMDGDVEIQTRGDDSFAVCYGEDGDPECWPVSINASYIVLANPQNIQALLTMLDKAEESFEAIKKLKGGSFSSMACAVEIAEAALENIGE